MYLIKADPQANFKVWHKFNDFMNSANELVKFIDNGILDTAPKLFKTLFNNAEAKIADAYAALLQTVNANYPELRNVDWKLHFESGIYEITPSKEVFDARRVLFSTLSLKPEYEKTVQRAAGDA